MFYFVSGMLIMPEIKMKENKSISTLKLQTCAGGYSSCFAT